MKVFNPKRDNGLRFIYDRLYIFFQAYDYGGLSDEEYSRFKTEILSDGSWKERFGKLSERKLRKYNIAALLSLIRLLDVGAISKEEYDAERKKIVIKYKDKNANYFDL